MTVVSQASIAAAGHAIRRVVTGHDDAGKAIIESDGPAPNVRVREGTGFVSTLLWVTDETPALGSLRIDRADRTIGTAPPPNGTILRIVDFPPVTPEVESVSQKDLLRTMGLDAHDADGAKPRHPYMHRTRSVDYGIILSGEIDMLLDDSEVHLKAGDVVVQQGTNHAWVNRSDECCRIAFVLIDGRDPLDKP
jgi:mannose-6-phosphate isomerase-like protein (cupin superfamily)